MKLCFPVQRNEGMKSDVLGHFGSAPAFIVVDTETNDVITITNDDQHHAHGACNPVMALHGHTVDALVVVGIGAGALSKLNQSGIRVYQSQASTVQGNIDIFTAGSLPEFMPQNTCGGHEGECSH
ncbi:MAG TPA: diguanylate cyclase [Nitrospiraceae bacterium]|nr:diguanylate cyclase [Nitrospiraceae bacterium]